MSGVQRRCFTHWVLIADLAKESQEAKVEEDRSQKDYAAFMSGSSQSHVEKGSQSERVAEHVSVHISEFDQIEGELVSTMSCAAEPEQGDQFVASML